MTILGCHVLTAHMGVCWADDEVYVRGAVHGLATKLIINSTGFAFAYSGWSAVASAVAGAVSNANCFSEAFRTVPRSLRKACETVIERVATRSASLFSVVILIGWDRENRSVRAYVMDGANLFHPLQRNRFLSPEIENPYPPGTDIAVIGQARKQFSVLRRDLPAATGGTLAVATITPGTAQVRQIWNFAARDSPAWLPRRPPEPDINTAAAKPALQLVK